MDISGDVEAKRRTLKILVFGIHPAEFDKEGLVLISSMLDDTRMLLEDFILKIFE